MALQWTPDLSVGVAEIDKQHQELFRRTNQLLTAMSQGKGREEVQKMMNFLGDYVVEHFSSEESRMVKSNYPGYTTHKKIHVDFVNDFTKLKSEIEGKGSTVSATIRIQRWLTDWLVNHISKIDKQFGKFLEENK